MVLEPIIMEVVPAALSISGKALSVGPNLSSGLSVSGIRLDRLQRTVNYFTAQGPSIQMQQLWANNCIATERALESLQEQIDFQATILASIQAAQEAAAQANQGVETLNAGVSLSSSRTDPVDGLLTATSDGVVSISAHGRVYTVGGVETSVAVNAGSVSGFASGDFVRVYYNDAAREGGAVAYIGTTGEITQVGDVHVVGGVVIPGAGQPPTEGTGTTPPGYVRKIESVT